MKPMLHFCCYVHIFNAGNREVDAVAFHTCQKEIMFLQIRVFWEEFRIPDL